MTLATSRRAARIAGAMPNTTPVIVEKKKRHDEQARVRRDVDLFHRRGRQQQLRKHTRGADRQHGAEDAARRREQQTLHEELSNHAEARRPHRETNADLPAPRRRANADERGEVGAGDDENERNDADQHDERQPHAPAHARQTAICRLERYGPRRAVPDAFTGCFLEALPNDTGPRGSGFGRLPGRAPGEHVEPHPRVIDERAVGGEQHGMHRQRNPGVRFDADLDAEEPRRRHADDGERVVVDDDSFTDRRVRRAEPRAPVTIADHDDRTAHQHGIVRI